MTSRRAAYDWQPFVQQYRYLDVVFVHAYDGEGEDISRDLERRVQVDEKRQRLTRARATPNKTDISHPQRT